MTERSSNHGIAIYIQLQENSPSAANDFAAVMRQRAIQYATICSNTVDECEFQKQTYLQAGYVSLAEETIKGGTAVTCVSAHGETDKEAIACAWRDAPPQAVVTMQNFESHAERVELLERAHTVEDAARIIHAKRPSDGHTLGYGPRCVRQPWKLLGLVKRPGVYSAAWILPARVMLHFAIPSRYTLVMRLPSGTAAPIDERKQYHASSIPHRIVCRRCSGSGKVNRHRWCSADDGNDTWQVADRRPCDLCEGRGAFSNFADLFEAHLLRRCPKRCGGMVTLAPLDKLRCSNCGINIRGSIFEHDFD